MRLPTRRDSSVVWIGVIWLGALCFLSLWLWGAVITTPWIKWAGVFFEALPGIPGLTLKSTGPIWGLAVLFAAALSGRSVLSRIVPESPPLSMCAGAGLVVFALFGAGMGGLGLYLKPWLVGLVLLALVVSLADLLNCLRKNPGGWRTRFPLRPREMAALCPAVIIVFLAALNPTLFFDALYYHLPLPKHYLFTGSTHPVAWHALSFFPSNMEMLHGFAIAGGGGIASQVMMAGIWLFAVLAIRDLGARFISPEAGFAALLVALCSLTFALSALMVTTDTFVLLLTMGGLYSICGAREAAENENLPAFSSWLVCWALFAGGAAGIKYTVWITGISLQGLLVLFISFKMYPSGLRPLALAFVLAFLVLLPWPLRNYFASGNPVMPVPVGDLFPGLSRTAWMDLKRDAHSVVWTLDQAPRNLAAPWLMVFDDWKTLAREWGEARFVGPFIWMGAPLVILFRRRARMPGVIWTYGLAATLISISMIHIIRYAYPGLGAMAIVAGCGLSAWYAKAVKQRIALYAGGLFIAAALLLCAAILARTSANLTAGYRFPRARGDLERYMSDRAEINFFEAGVVCFQLEANRVLDREAVVLMVGETRFFYLDRLCVAPSFLDPNPLLELLRRVPPRSAADALADWEFTHVMVSMPELDRLSSKYRILNLTPELRQRAHEFARGPWCRPVLEDKDAGFVMCEIARD